MIDAAAGDRPALGSLPTDGGTQFAVVSLVADAVEVCVFDEHGAESRHRLELAEGGIWHGVVAGVGPGVRYGYRVAADPERGAWSEPSNLLLDPYARAIEGAAATDHTALSGPPHDTAPDVPRSLVVDEAFEWPSGSEPPRREWADTVIYEAHVKGLTATHPRVPPELRGTYSGVESDSVLAHLVELGVTAVELMPIHEIVDEGPLVDKGLTNYWGYNSIGYFAPAERYSADARRGVVAGQVREFKSMVASLHRAGLEVILDVVYNHTAESDEQGPVLSFRGLDPFAYYRHDDAGHLVDTTGCGNSLNAASTVALSMVLDSLRYWVQECRVDGFRFDLAPTLARPRGQFDGAAPFLQLCAQDPVLRDVKLIAEPWDVGQPDSYALGQFPVPFREWNGAFRDTMRDVWRSEDGTLGAFATRFAGSSDLFDRSGRTATSSINFVTAHDGFTLQDLVSYDDKHNEANLEDNVDGTDDNRSWNCGVEGDTDDPEVLAQRGRQARALLASLVLACGVPMLLAGDELGRTQRGNNNAYCQDNELSWVNWESVDAERLDFTRRLLELRREHAAFRRFRFMPHGVKEALGWFTPDGVAMDDDAWDDPGARCVAIRLEAEAHAEDADGSGDDVVVLVNTWWEQVEFTLPDVGHSTFELVLDTFDAARGPQSMGDRAVVGPRSLQVLRAVRQPRGRAAQRR